MTGLLQRLELEQASFRPAKVNCVYVNYPQARYPNARFAAKAALETVLVLEGTVVRAALMPLEH